MRLQYEMSHGDIHRYHATNKPSGFVRCRGGQHSRLHPFFLLLDLLLQRFRVRERGRFGVACRTKVFGHFKVLVETDDSGGAEGETQRRSVGIPIPVLKKHGHARDGGHFTKPSSRLQRHNDIAATSCDTKHERCFSLYWANNIKQERVELCWESRALFIGFAIGAIPFRMPVDRMAPILDIVFWCLSVMTDKYLSLQRL